jgi:hypothetical protein
MLPAALTRPRSKRPCSTHFWTSRGNLLTLSGRSHDSKV